MLMFVLGRYEFYVKLSVWKFVFLHVEYKVTINAPFNCIMSVTTSFISALLHDTLSCMYIYIARMVPASNKTFLCNGYISICKIVHVYERVSVREEYSRMSSMHDEQQQALLHSP